MFVIRNQGYFYTDEYFAPDGGFQQVLKQAFDSREAADAANAKYCRGRMRAERLIDFLFDDPEASARVEEYLRAKFPDAYDYDANNWSYEQEATAPEEATDAQIDELIALSGIVFAKVFEYDEEIDESPIDPMMADELYFGPEHEVRFHDD